MPKHTRRRFLADSVAAATAAAFSPALIARAQGNKKSPNERLSVAIVGVRGRGGSHIQGFLANENTEITYLCDVDEKVGQDRSEKLAQKQGRKPKFVRDMRAIFDDASVDIVTTATPNHWHALCGLWAMQAGKDTYLEKPVCHNVAEGAALVAAARKYGRMCQVGTQCRSSRAVREAMQFLAEGGIGEVKFARGLCYKRRKSIGPLGNYPIPPEVDYNLWSGPAPVEPVTRPQFHYDWHWQRLYGNGDLGNQGPHQTDIARWGLGVDAHPNRVITYGGRLGYQAERNDDAYVDAGDTANTEVSIYDYGDKCIVFETRGLSVDDSADEELNTIFRSTKGNKIGVVFYGSDGILVQRTYDHCIAYDKNLNPVKEFKGGEDHYDNFVEACLSRKVEDLNADVREGHLSAAISHFGNVSYYAGEKNKVSVEELKRVLSGIKSLDDNLATLERTVKHLVDNGVDLAKYPISLGPMLEIDPEAETITNHAEANAMLTREYRAPFVVPKPADV